MMKKLAAFFLTCMIGLVLALTGCSNDDVFTQKSYSSDEEEIGKMTVRVEDRELEIGASEDRRIHVDYFDGEKEFLEIAVSGSGELTVKLQSRKNWTDYIGTKPSAEYRKVRIRIPDGFLAVFSASTTNGDIRINELSCSEQLECNVNGGSILCDRVSAGTAIAFTAKNGDIAGAVLGGWDDFSISCKIKKGACNLPTLKEGGEKSFSADCNHGDIRIEFIR